MEKPGERYSISLLDIATLLYNMWEGRRQKRKVGFEDANNTITWLTRRLSKRSVFIDKEALQSALWSANLMDEAHLFWSPNGEEFEKFVGRLLSTAGAAAKDKKFDRTYNLIVPKKEKA